MRRLLPLIAVPLCLPLLSCSPSGPAEERDRSDDVRQACQKQGEQERLALLKVGVVVRDAPTSYHAEVTGQVPGGANSYRCDARVVDGSVQAKLVLVHSSPIGLPPTTRR